MAKNMRGYAHHAFNAVHNTARDQYLSERGPLARRRRAAERGGTISTKHPLINPDNVIEENGLSKWENDLLGGNA
jgi:hypothetical protein